MFFLLPAGLVLYWVVNNFFSIAQQWQITRDGRSVGRPRRVVQTLTLLQP